jgi:hypothetical protein
MIIVVQRVTQDSNCTIGEILSGEQSGATLEPPYQPVKVMGHTRIPAGQYVLKLRTDGSMSPQYTQKFGADFHKGMLWLQDVPDFEDVYLHIGNYPRDTEGCILVATNAGEDAINSSTAFYQLFYPPVAAAILAGEEVVVDVRDIQP